MQPTVKSTLSNVSYVETPPHDDLQDLIYCYWQLQSLEPLTETFFYRIVADACMDIYFNLDQTKESYVIGFCKQYTEFPLERTFNYAGVRFFPSVFSQLFAFNASELTDQYADLDTIIPGLAEYISERIAPEAGLNEISNAFNHYFLNHLYQHNSVSDPRILHAIEQITAHQGALSIEKLDVGLSSRQLRRLFEFQIGASPKVFSKIVRFQQLLNANPSLESLRKNKIFFDVGYYDQAHFIREFKHFYGDTPHQAFED